MGSQLGRGLTPDEPMRLSWRAISRVLPVALVAAACSTPLAEEPISIEVGSESLSVVVADSYDERRQGLRGVESLPRGVDGMLFEFDALASRTFNMVGVSIPLDIWWFDEDGHLIGSARMEPCTVACTDYGSPGPVGWALETVADEFDLVGNLSISSSG